MNVKNILSWFAFLGGEAIVISSFLLWRGSLSDEILILNVIVSVLIYGLFFFDVIFPLVDLRDSSGKKIGAIGIRWIVTCVYAILAVSIMILCNISFQCTFRLQLVLHCVLALFLLIGILAMLHSSGQIANVYQEQREVSKGLDEMKASVEVLLDTVYCCNQPNDFYIDRVRQLQKKLRYLSPSNNAEAASLEHQFSETVNNIRIALSNQSLNKEQIESDLKKAEYICQKRKSLYSN